MNKYGGILCLLALPGAGSVQGQVRVGDGLTGDYYDGREFNKFVASRRDATINFDWHGARPIAGLEPEDFSVRWTGWLVPPTTGHYTLHISVDDGIRVWLNNRLLLDDWRGQPLSYYQVAVDLKAGEPYALRIDYCQYSFSTRARLAWLEPPAQVPASTWRNLWGAAESKGEPVVIPTRYLFSRFPGVAPPQPPALVVSPPPVTARLPDVAAAAQHTPPPASRATGPSVAALATPPPPAVAGLAARRSALAFVRRVPPAAPPTPMPTPARPADTGVRAAASRLAEGQAVTLRALYFAQGKAYLLPAVQTSLDTLAQALARRPALHLEVQGHTDNQGDSTLNYQLSQRRAEAVCRYLAAHGVAADRLRAVGYGGRLPVADNNQPALRPRNRRVVLQPLRNN